jgi:hypothetical protein
MLRLPLLSTHCEPAQRSCTLPVYGAMPINCTKPPQSLAPLAPSSMARPRLLHDPPILRHLPWRYSRVWQAAPTRGAHGTISAICAQVADIMAGRYAPETSAISRSIDLLRVGLSYSHATRVAGGELIVAVIGNCIHFAFYPDAHGEGDHDPTSPTASPRRSPLPATDFIRLLSRALRGIEWRGGITSPSAGDDRLYNKKGIHRHIAMDAYGSGASAGHRPASLSRGPDLCTGRESVAELDTGRPRTSRDRGAIPGHASCGMIVARLDHAPAAGAGRTAGRHLKGRGALRPRRAQPKTEHLPL